MMVYRFISGLLFLGIGGSLLADHPSPPPTPVIYRTTQSTYETYYGPPAPQYPPQTGGYYQHSGATPYHQKVKTKEFTSSGEQKETSSYSHTLEFTHKEDGGTYGVDVDITEKHSTTHMETHESTYDIKEQQPELQHLYSPFPPPPPFLGEFPEDPLLPDQLPPPVEQTGVQLPYPPQPDVIVNESDPTIFLELEKRAKDLEKSFQRLAAAHPEERFFAVVNGQSIDGVTDVKAMPGGTMVMLTIDRGVGVETRSVPTDEFEELGVRPSYKGRENIKIPEGW